MGGAEEIDPIRRKKRKKNERIQICHRSLPFSSEANRNIGMGGKGFLESKVDESHG